MTDTGMSCGALEVTLTWNGDDIEGDYSALAQVRDPHGNLVTLATPPSRPFPPA